MDADDRLLRLALADGLIKGEQPAGLPPQKSRRATKKRHGLSRPALIQCSARMRECWSDDDKIRIAKGLLRRRRAGEIPPVWIGSGAIFVCVAPREMWPLGWDAGVKRIGWRQAERLAEGEPLESVLMRTSGRRKARERSDDWQSRRAEYLSEAGRAA